MERAARRTNSRLFLFVFILSLGEQQEQPRRPLVLTLVAVGNLTVHSWNSGPGTGSTFSQAWEVPGDSNRTFTPEVAIPSFMERRNYTGSRDSFFIREVLAWSNENPAVTNARTIGSRQAGMVIFYLRANFPDITFVDAWSLSTNDFAGCKGLDSARSGLQVSWNYWLANAGDCAPEMPDLLFDLGRFPSALSTEYCPVVELNDFRTHRGDYSRSIAQWLAVNRDSFPDLCHDGR